MGPRRVLDEPLTNEKLFKGDKEKFTVVNEAIKVARSLIESGKDVLNPSYETLRSLAEGHDLSFPDRPKRPPMEIVEHEGRPSRGKKSALLEE